MPPRKKRQVTRIAAAVATLAICGTLALTACAPEPPTRPNDQQVVATLHAHGVPGTSDTVLRFAHSICAAIAGGVTPHAILDQLKRSHSAEDAYAIASTSAAAYCPETTFPR